MKRKIERIEMISKIVLNGVASYKKEAVLDTDKKVNLLYGLNGTGKSTFRNSYMIRQEQDFHNAV